MNRQSHAIGLPWQILILIVASLLVLVGIIAAPKLKLSATVNEFHNVYLLIIRESSLDLSLPHAVVFVSRQIPDRGSIYWDKPNGMPGVGPYSRFQVAAPGKLQILESNGVVLLLVDGANPGQPPLDLIDVNAPDVSFDGTQIVFAGFPASAFSAMAGGVNSSPGGWRIYAINVGGSGPRQITTSDLDYGQLDMFQFGPVASIITGYDDTDPVWLPDSRIVFSSTRWPSLAQYSGVRATNLHVVNASGGKMRRITLERNGAERPLVDPLTGQIVYARWWRNHRFAVDGMDTIVHPDGGYIQHNGLTIERNHVGRHMNLWTNHWQIAAINPDGTGLEMWGGRFRGENDNHYYGGAFT